jgi:uncharacterized membrane protein
MIPNELIIQTIVFYSFYFLGGFILLLFPPKINKWYGMRTKKSLKSSENWYIAQAKSAKYIMLFSLVLFLISLFVKFVSGAIINALALYVLIDILLIIIATFVTYFLVEQKIIFFSNKNIETF